MTYVLAAAAAVLVFNGAVLVGLFVRAWQRELAWREYSAALDRAENARKLREKRAGRP